MPSPRLTPVPLTSGSPSFTIFITCRSFWSRPGAGAGTGVPPDVSHVVLPTAPFSVVVGGGVARVGVYLRFRLSQSRTAQHHTMQTRTRFILQYRTRFILQYRTRFLRVVHLVARVC